MQWVIVWGWRARAASGRRHVFSPQRAQRQSPRPAPSSTSTTPGSLAAITRPQRGGPGGLWVLDATAPCGCLPFSAWPRELHGVVVSLPM